MNKAHIFLIAALFAVCFSGLGLGARPAHALSHMNSDADSASDDSSDDRDSADSNDNDSADRDDDEPAHRPVPAVTGNWWHPHPGTSWQVQYSDGKNKKGKGKKEDDKEFTDIDMSYKVSAYDIDLVDTDPATIDALHKRGVKVICYFSAGSSENWRPDFSRFPKSVLGKNMEGWEGERWLDIRKLDVLRPIMEDRVKLAVKKKCDAVDPDNVEGFENKTGFPLSFQDQIAYNTMISDIAHKAGLAVGLKNDTGQIEDLVGLFDFAVNEQCFEQHSCNDMLPFIRANKPVFNIEYKGDPAQFCPKANAMNFDSLLKKLELDAWVKPCR